jgi:hypothetical protein
LRSLFALQVDLRTKVLLPSFVHITETNFSVQYYDRKQVDAEWLLRNPGYIALKLLSGNVIRKVTRLFGRTL